MHRLAYKVLYVDIKISIFKRPIEKVDERTLHRIAHNCSWYPKYSNDVCVPDASECNTIGLPRHYIAHHLNGKTIVVDGHGTDQAWAEVPWSETYLGIHM